MYLIVNSIGRSYMIIVLIGNKIIPVNRIDLVFILYKSYGKLPNSCYVYTMINNNSFEKPGLFGMSNFDDLISKPFLLKWMNLRYSMMYPAIKATE